MGIDWRCIVVAVLALLAVFDIGVIASAPAPPSTVLKPSDRVIQELEGLKAEVFQIKAELKAARDKEKEEKPLGAVEKAVLILTFVLTFLMALGAGSTIFFGIRFETRAQEVHRLSTDGASTVQAHSEAFLKGSERTLTLVNQTLELARQATRRTVKSVEIRLRNQIESLDRAAVALVSTESSQSDRKLVTNLEVRRRLEAISEEVGEAERELRRLTFETSGEGANRIRLTPACLFIRGMTHHLDGRWRKARDYWDEAVHADLCSPVLASTIWYWIGYEQNNVGESADDESVTAFQKAQAHAAGVRGFELRRLELESRFFHTRRRLPALRQPEERILLYQFGDGLVAVAKELEQETGTEYRAARMATVTTVGNIRLSVGNWWLSARGGTEAEAHKQLVLALEQYDKALDTYDTTKRGANIWALFGRAQALERLHKLKQDGFVAAPALETGPDLTRDPRPDYRAVLHELRDTEFGKRREPRTRMLNYATQVRCGIGLKARRVVESALIAITDGQASVEEPVTIYSQEMKCNVDKDTWLEEVAAMRNEARDVKGWADDHEFV